MEALLRRGLRSTYHHHHQVEHGHEKHPTQYQTWNKERPFHLDYVFLPEARLPRIKSVEVGEHEKWKTASDHRPVVVDINFAGHDERRV